MATENIGLARLRNGTTLVRIGAPLRPEFAAWRYGDQFGRRRRRQMLIVGSGVAALAAGVGAGAAAGVGIAGFASVFGPTSGNVIGQQPETVVAKIRTDQGSVLHVRRKHLARRRWRAAITAELAINLRFKNGQGTFVGREAERIAAIVIRR